MSMLTCKHCDYSFVEEELRESYVFDEDGMEHPINDICPNCSEPDCLEDKDEGIIIQGQKTIEGSASLKEYMNKRAVEKLREQLND